MFGIIGAIAGLVGIGTSIVGGMNQAKANGKMVAAQKEEEGVRHKQMLLDNARQRREIIRNSIVAQGMAEAAGVNQGAGTQSSGVQGGIEGVQNQESSMISGLNQNLIIGEKVFNARNKYYAAGGQYAAAQGLSAIGGGLTSLGNFMLGNAGTLSQLGQFAFG